MIISSNNNAKNNDFESLLTDTQYELEELLSRSPESFSKGDAFSFEKNVFEAMSICARGTNFDKTIELISGHKFPDIIANEYYGVEVKTTKQNHWTTVGNSVLESTRIDGVERIYLMFGKMAAPVQFKFRKYQDCLYDVAVTHSPRYLIDMNLKRGESIFSKMSIEYDALRKLDNPISPVIDYYKKSSSKSNNVWWINDEEEKAVSMEIKMWSNLLPNDKKKLIAKAMFLFPEVFLNSSSTKYDKVAAWLIKEYGIVSSSLRDSFSAGGKVTLIIDAVKYKNIPKVFGRLIEYIDLIKDSINEVVPSDLTEYWQLPKSKANNLISFDDRLDQWLKELTKILPCALKETKLTNKVFISYIKEIMHE